MHMQKTVTLDVFSFKSTSADLESIGLCHGHEQIDMGLDKHKHNKPQHTLDFCLTASPHQLVLCS